MLRPAAAARMSVEFERLLPVLRNSSRDVFYLDRHGRRLGILLDPRLVESVLISGGRHFGKGAATQFWRGAIGDGTASRPPLTVYSNATRRDVGDWRRFLRRAMMQHFSGSRFAAYQGQALAEAQRLEDDWERRPERELVADARTLALGNFARCFADEASRAYLQRASDTIFHSRAAMKTAVNAPLACPFDVNRTAWHRVVQAAQVLYRPQLYQVARRAGVLSAMFRKIDSTVRRDERNVNLFASLARAADTYGDEIPRGDVPGLLQVIFVAGTETVSSALTWLMWHLASDPGLQQRIVDSDSPDHSLLRSCIYESLRLHPPSWSIPREAVHRVRVRGASLDRGTVLLASPLIQHYQDDSYPDPHEFQAERFLTAPRLSGRYYPFGLGVRTCPAMSFAVEQLDTLLRKLLWSWQLEAVADRSRAPRQWLGLELGVSPGQMPRIRVTRR